MNQNDWSDNSSETIPSSSYASQGIALPQAAQEIQPEPITAEQTVKQEVFPPSLSDALKLLTQLDNQDRFSNRKLEAARVARLEALRRHCFVLQQGPAEIVIDANAQAAVRHGHAGSYQLRADRLAKLQNIS